MKFNIKIRESSFGNQCDGAIEILENEVIFFKKSRATRAFFGAIGVAIAGGKEVLRFSAEDIQSYQITEGAFSSSMSLVLKDENYVKFKLSGEVESALAPILNVVTAQD